MIAQVDLPAKYISTFRTSRLTTAKWKDLIINARAGIGDSEDKDDSSKTNEGAEDDKMEEDNDSIPSGSEEGDFSAVEPFEIAWDCSISQVGREADWALTVQAHRTAIDLLDSVLNSWTRCHIACIKTLNARADLGSQEANDIRQQLQRLLQVVHEHKTLADSVNAALEAGHASAKALEDLKGEMDTFANSLKDFSKEAKVTSKKILKIIVLIRQRAQTRDDNMCARILQIESVIGGFQRPQSSPPSFQQHLLSSPKEGDTPLLGTILVGGSDTTITANLLFNLIR